MAEVVLFLLQQGWWWSLLWVCLAASVRAVPAAAAGQKQCEVLDPNIQSTFSLPTNLTVKPTAPGWKLDFALLEGEAPPVACVRLQQTESKVQVTLLKGDCMNGVIQVYRYLPGASVPPRAWTTLALDVKDKGVRVTALNSVSIPLKVDSWSLPRDALHVTVARGVEAAVGCRVNCPLYRHASEGHDKKKTVKKSCQDHTILYFLPSEEFVRLEYEVTCTTREGTEEFLPIANIVTPHNLTMGLWYIVELKHLDGEVEVRLNYKSLKKKLPKGCTFTEHTIKLVGDSHFSFSCSPYTGEVKGMEDDSWYCPTSPQSYFKYYPWAAVLTLTGVVADCLLFVVYFAWRQQDKYPWVVVVTLVVVVVVFCLLWAVYWVRKMRRAKVKAGRIGSQHNSDHHTPRFPPTHHRQHSPTESDSEGAR